MQRNVSHLNIGGRCSLAINWLRRLLKKIILMSGDTVRGREMATFYVNRIDAAAILDCIERLKKGSRATKFAQSTQNLAQRIFGPNLTKVFSTDFPKLVVRYSQSKLVAKPPNRKVRTSQQSFDVLIPNLLYGRRTS